MLYSDAKKLFSDALAGKIRLEFGNPVHVEAVRMLEVNPVNFSDIQCEHCYGTGTKRCDRCYGKGKILCAHCDGTGHRAEDD
jgi:hypothetical protein